MDPLGRYCWASRHADMAARLQRKVDDGEMKPSELESLVRYMGMLRHILLHFRG